MDKEYGVQMYEIAKRLFPICRSITGSGVRETLKILGEYAKGLTTYEVPTGTEVFDWTVPKEWAIREAYIENEQGNHIVDYKDSNLHVMGYSGPVDQWVDLQQLKEYIYTQEDQPQAIPYVTSYYKERYGFCMTKIQKDSLKEGKYHMVIDSELFDGSLTYGELIIPGKSEQEILISTYICHPSMANNECSGPALAITLANWLHERKDRRYTYRILFLPETIGSITYLSKHIAWLKDHVQAGFVLSCVGDDRDYSIIESRYGKTLADRALKSVLSSHAGQYSTYSFLQRGSDERQYNAPGVDLPVVAFCRSKYGEYPEYHTSMDNMELVSPDGFAGAFAVMRKTIELLEHNRKYKMKVLCEPQLGKRGLYPTVSRKGIYQDTTVLRDFIAYADGTMDLMDIAQKIQADIEAVLQVSMVLLEHGLIGE
ncbi:DUF4910 domain-containing protein [Lachnospiraceae bacterium]|nr:DUF4910 domain-containing protein [Lachnospiraceae bacterium]